MEEGVSDILESTRGVLRALEALYGEHKSIMASEGLEERLSSVDEGRDPGIHDRAWVYVKALSYR